MPISPGAAGLITAPIGGFLSSMNTAFENRQNRKWSENMYQRQYDDNLALWNRQNEYNSPQAQMRRFQEAGLNPNLIYSQGNPGNAVQLQSPTPQRPQFESSRFDAGLGAVPSALDNIYNLEMKQQQVDNLKMVNLNLEKDAMLKLINIDRARLGYNQDLEYSSDYKRERLRAQTILNDNAVAENIRREISLSSNLREATERILNMQQSREKGNYEIQRVQEVIKLMKQDGRLRDFELMLNQSGVSKNDELWQRLLAAFLYQQGINPINGTRRR